MSDSLKKFQSLLRELFQFDCADLDFGIYRIMNYKRDVIEKFIAKDLPKTVAATLEQGMLSEQAHLAEEISAVLEQIRENLGSDAVDGDGNLNAIYHDSPIGKRYLQLIARNRGVRNATTIGTSVFNHLFSFFNRYYQGGDFISKQRYSRKQRYAIPYNGEEVHLHWANHDQYYIKTTEYFNHYSFQAQNITFHFRVQAAELEQDNIKGDKNFFLLSTKGIAWNRKAKELIIPFEYRPLDEQEKSGGSTRQQDRLNDQALKEILGKVPTQEVQTALTGKHYQDTDGESVSVLEHHLRQYTRRNTSDFFIHKNLKGFLSRELDFYLKNEMLNLEEMEHAGEDLVEGWFQEVRAIKMVGNQIIDFLHQIESFQKMLWEKRKFITETQYCVTMGNIDPVFYPDIAACESQWNEWKELLHIDEEEANLFNPGKDAKEKRILFLEQHPTLILDTKHFTSGFIDRLLENFDDLDEVSDGLLIHSDNWQALSLIAEQYRGRVECIHIDPPYNTQTSGFLYKNDYQHSSWLTMMHNRIENSYSLLTSNSFFLCHIDESEYERLHMVFEAFPTPDAGTIIWDKRNPMPGGKGIATQHEYVICRSTVDQSIRRRNENFLAMHGMAQKILKKHGGINKKARDEYAQWINAQRKLTQGEKAYRFLDDEGRIYQSVTLKAPEPRIDPKFFEPLIHPVTGKPCAIPPNGFSRTPETLQKMVENGEISFGDDETSQPRQRLYLPTDAKAHVSSVIPDTTRGKKELKNLGLEDFPYCHSSLFYEKLMAMATRPDSWMVDNFAGSGTSGHAIVSLNRLDGGQRKFVLADMGHHFDSFILPRLKKVIFTPKWKGGVPSRKPTQEESIRSPRLIKYIRLESYEDALNNIDFDETTTQKALELDGYLLRYMLQWETKRSNTLLNTEKLANPFDYKLRAGNQLQEVVTDIPETFNYLLGLHVRTRKSLSDGKRQYLVYRGKTRDDRDTVVIWRNTDGWQKNDLEKDRKFVTKHKLTVGADQVFVNGDSLIREATSLDPLFKARMFAEVEA